MRDEKCGYVDLNGKVVIPFNFSACGDFSKGIAHAYTRESVMGYINQQGAWAISPKFTSGWYFNDDIAAVAFHGKFGYIDRMDRVLIPCRFDTAFPFHGGLASVTLNRRAASINHAGQVVWQEAEDQRAKNKKDDGPPKGSAAH